ncbi:MAG: sugar ABC transporter substrate-binding protein [Finegoldia sp.]|nr:sugar ABC transporter substrate-binding protein [Finegoldia sp.]
MKRSKKTLLALLSVFVLFLSACGSSNKQSEENTSQDSGKTEEKSDTTSSEEVVLNILVPGYDTGYLKPELDSIIPNFEKENPNIKVQVVSAGWDELNSKIIQLHQANKACDVMFVGSRSLRQFAENGILEDLTGYVTDEQKENYIESVFATGKVNDKQYGIPMAFSSRGLFYRSDLIKNPPTNWDELLQVSKEQTSGNRKGFAIPTDITSGTDEILNFIYQNGGKIVDENGNFVINSKKNIETLEYLKKLVDYIPDPVSTARDDQAQLFINDNLAMFISGGWETPTLDENVKNSPYSVAMLPDGKQKAVTLVTDSYTIDSTSEHKEEAYKFIEFMGKLENQKLITASHGWFPVLKAEADNEIYKSEVNKPMYEMIQYGIPEPQVPSWDDFNKSFTIAVQKTLTGEMTAEESLNECQQEVSK